MAAALDIAFSAGVRRLYTVPGESFLPLLDGAQHVAGIQVISTRHESGASFMAEADAKITGVPAIVSATRAVGASNLAIGVHTAHQDSTPMLVILGQVQASFMGREAFQEIDLPAFYRPLVKSAVGLTRGDALPEAVARALRIATTGRPGPTMIAVPMDLFEAEVISGPTATWSPAPRPQPNDAEISELYAAISAARNPVIIAGGGARHAHVELVQLAERLSVGVYSAFRRQDVFPNDHPLYLGHLTFNTPAATLAALVGADVVVVLGSRLSEITTQAYRVPTVESRVYQVDIDPAVVAARVGARGIVGDVCLALRALLREAVEPVVPHDWRDARAAYVAEAELPREGVSSPVQPADVIRAMRDTLPPNTILTNDAGNHSIFLHRYWSFTRPLTQVAPTSGAMGYAVPAAVGAKLASPESPVVAVVGDGGFLMTGQEIETAVRLDTPIIVVVFRNALLGTIAMHQARSMGRATGVAIGDVDLAAYARALGADGISIHDSSQLRPALRQALDSGRTTVIDVELDSDVIAPGLSLRALTEGAAKRVVTPSVRQVSP